ncbi:MAG: hypothetical protein QM537_02920 [Candidatus Symbiobacter sp.]|nr:hypothetical protein [Candidatus Symbiobacter sp.]
MHQPIHRISLSRCNRLKNLLIQENFALRIRTRLVRLSKDNRDKNRSRHPDLSDHDYELIPKIIEYGSASILKNEPNRLVFVWTNPVTETHYTVAIKQSRRGEIFLLSLYRNRKARIALGSIILCEQTSNDL